MGQELATAMIVTGAAGYLGLGAWKKYGAEALANFFLRRGKIGLAMRLKRQSRAGCTDCH